MITLGLDTSTKLGSLALFQDGRCLGSRISFEQKSHSEFINSSLSELLQQNNITLNQINLIALGVGPGSFTGIRISFNVAKTISYAFGIPILPVDSLMTLSLEAIQKSSLPILCILNAYKNMVYYASFDLSRGIPIILKPPSVTPVKSLHKVLPLKPYIVLGDAYKTYLEHFPKELAGLFVRDNTLSDFPSAETLCHHTTELNKSIPTKDWKSIIPLYIRASEAEENKRGILFTPL